MIEFYNQKRNTVWFQIILTLILFKIAQLYFLFFYYNPTSPILLQASFTENPYHAFSIFLSSFLNPAILFSLFTIYFIIYKSHGTLNNIKYNSNAERIIVLIGAGLLTWELISSNGNYYLQNNFYLDKFILLAFCMQLWRSPICLPAFLALALLFRSQYNYPIGGFSLADKRTLLDVLMMYSVLLLFKKRITLFTNAFVYLTLCIVASHYLASGIDKLTISPHGYEWITENNLNDFFFNAHARGWFSSITTESLESVYLFFNTYGTSIQFLVVVIELSLFFILWKRKLAIVLLLLSTILHIGIFLAGSMLFWKWIAMDITLILVLILYKNELQSLFNKKMFGYSIIIIITSFLWLKPIAIGWNDTPLNQFFTYEVVDKNNNSFSFPKNYFNPYDKFIQTDVFYYLINKKLIPVTGFGYIGRYKIADAIRKSSPKELKDLENKFGVNRFDIKKKIKFKRFMQTFFTNRNKMGSSFLSYIPAPYHLNNGVFGEPYQKGIIKTVRVYFNQTWRYKSKVVWLQKEICEEINIP